MSNTYSIPMFRPIAQTVTRYAGSKRRLIPLIRKNLPSQWNNYFEPFCGGLSVYCAIVNTHWDSKSYWISDYNSDLIRTYRYIRDEPHEMFDILWNYHLTHTPDQWKETIYLPKENETELQLAARYWYIVRHSFSNGMATSNKRWINNGPMTTSYYKPNLQKTLALSAALANTNTKIECCSYEDIAEHIQPEDFVYLDPPYLGASNNIYQNMLDDNEHIKLADFARELAKRGAYVMISNYDNETTRELYKGMRFDTQSIVNTMENKGGKRKYVNELLAMAW